VISGKGNTNNLTFSQRFLVLQRRHNVSFEAGEKNGIIRTAGACSAVFPGKNGRQGYLGGSRVGL
jgi:hypothetical protein